MLFFVTLVLMKVDPKSWGLEEVFKYGMKRDLPLCYEVLTQIEYSRSNTSNLRTLQIHIQNSDWMLQF